MARSRVATLAYVSALAAVLAAAVLVLGALCRDRFACPVTSAATTGGPTAPAAARSPQTVTAPGDSETADTNREPPRPQDPRRAFLERLADAAVERTRHRVVYDPSYVRLDYPGGDVPDDRGVCADVIVRAYRKLGIDLQKLVHEDMRAHFGLYPSNWGLSRPDPNIDHRRVLNLKTFFERHGRRLPASGEPADYSPGDVVVWDLGSGLKHIGIVVSGRPADGLRPLVVHNIGRGPQAEDVLFAWRIIGHFQYVGPAGVSASDPGGPQER